MIFQSPGAIAFYIGSSLIHWYGLFFVIAFIVCTILTIYKVFDWKIKVKVSTVIYCIIFSFIVGYLGGRLFYVSLDWPYFSQHPDEIWQVWQGGLAIHGAILGSVLAGALVCRINKLPFLTCCDIGGIVIPLFQAIVRWGNFFNSESFGYPVSENFPIKVFIPAENRPPEYQNAEYFHPTFFYESIWDFAIFLLMFFYLSDKLKKYPGVGFLTYIVLYSVGRFFIELIRLNVAYWFGMPVASVLSIILILFALPAIFILKKRYSQGQN